MSHVFISYSKQNRQYARQLADFMLEQGFDVWIDDRIDYGVDWWDSIDKAIQDCAAVIVVMSPEAKASRWVQREVSLAEDRIKPVFPLLFSGKNWSMFVRTQYVDVSGGKIPPADYFDDLARHAARRATRGEEVVPVAHRPSADLTPHSRAAPLASPRRGGRLLWLVAAAAAVLVVALLALSQLGQRGTGDTSQTPPPTDGTALAALPTATLTPSPTPATPVAQPLREIPMYAGPGTNYPVLRKIPALELMTIIGVTSDEAWYQVTLMDGGQGWISRSPTFVALGGNLLDVPLMLPPFPTIAATPEPSATPPAASVAPVMLVPLTNGLRLREQPVDGNTISTLSMADVLVSLESRDETLAKVGLGDQWIHVSTLDGQVGYVLASFLDIFRGAIPDSAPIKGVNLLPTHPLGLPDPERLGNIGWVRLKFNVSYNPDDNTYGNIDLDAAFARYRPILENYRLAGYKVILVLGHQFYGEGRGFNWPLMDTSQWQKLSSDFAYLAQQTARFFADTDLVQVYQIWNEQDTNPQFARAAVGIPARDYANLLSVTIRAIRNEDSDALIITGGHVGGPSAGAAYARQTLVAMPDDALPDGIAFHPYGRGVRGNPFSNFGALDEEIRAYTPLLPDKPVWITEWGVLDRQGDLSIVADVADYAAGFMNIIAEEFPGQVAAAVWYAWADGIDNGYGLVDENDQPKQPLYDDFLSVE